MNSVLTELVTRSAFQVISCEVVCLNPDGSVLVAAEGGEPFVCLRLKTGPSLPPISAGDPVLCAVDGDAGKAYLLGLVVDSVAPGIADRKATFAETVPEADGEEESSEELPSEVVLRAKDKIEIRCGDGVIAVDEKGRILIRGTEVISRARKTNKVRGASVQIN